MKVNARFQMHYLVCINSTTKWLSELKSTTRNSRNQKCLSFLWFSDFLSIWKNRRVIHIVCRISWMLVDTCGTTIMIKIKNSTIISTYLRAINHTISSIILIDQRRKTCSYSIIVGIVMKWTDPTAWIIELLLEFILLIQNHMMCFMRRVSHASGSIIISLLVSCVVSIAARSCCMTGAPSFISPWRCYLACVKHARREVFRGVITFMRFCALVFKFDLGILVHFYFYFAEK